jgi:cell wall-associated NlpC family hydrolase
MRSKPMRALLIVVVALSSACAATGARPQPFPTGGRAPAVTGGDPELLPPAAHSGRSGYEVSGTALSLRGTPYRNGGADPNGFDCSGFVWYVFAQHGLSVPRTVVDQFRVGGNVDPSDLQPGDLVFFSTTDPGASHVGIAIGGDAFVHAPSSNGVVRVEHLGASYWAARFIGARRLR